MDEALDKKKTKETSARDRLSVPYCLVVSSRFGPKESILCRDVMCAIIVEMRHTAQSDYELRLAYTIIELLMANPSRVSESWRTTFIECNFYRYTYFVNGLM